MFICMKINIILMKLMFPNFGRNFYIQYSIFIDL